MSASRPTTYASKLLLEELLLATLLLVLLGSLLLLLGPTLLRRPLTRVAARALARVAPVRALVRPGPFPGPLARFRLRRRIPALPLGHLLPLVVIALHYPANLRLHPRHLHHLELPPFVAGNARQLLAQRLDALGAQVQLLQLL